MTKFKIGSDLQTFIMIKRSRMMGEAVGRARVRFSEFGICGEITDRIQ